MIRLWVGPLAFMLAGQSMAGDVCSDLWFSRNLVFDQVGYCFSSSLGQAVFDNADCTTRSPVLDPEAQAFVAWVKKIENLEECRVDTARDWLDIPLVEMRRQLRDRVAMSPFQSACIGWRGATVALRSGHSEGDDVIGYVRFGDTIQWEYESPITPSGWAFLTAKRRDGTTLAIGWSNAYIDPQYCDSLAG